MKTLKFGGKLDLLLLERDLTSEGLAKLSDVPLKTIERIRAGHSAPTVATLFRILAALRIKKLNLKLFPPADFEQSGAAERVRL